ncbi:MAG: nuclear transport factor 2 family protein [Bacteroidota bacterium]
MLLIGSANAQLSDESDFYKSLKSFDSLMFEVGFNRCNLSQIESMLPEHFQFFHDKDGMIQTKEAFVKTLETNLCSTGKNLYQRMLEEESFEVFPLKEDGRLYGAIVSGRHSFDNTIARFTNVFLLEDGRWFPSQMISYDHQPVKSGRLDQSVPLALTPQQQKLYVGDYKFSPDFILSIVREGTKLYGDSQGQKAEIIAFGNHRFMDLDQTMNLTFTTDESGLIIGLILEGPDGKMTAEKSK